MGFFVTATDTGVGKTYVLTLILKYLRYKGADPSAIKPIETGCQEINDKLIPEDGLNIAKALDQLSRLERICPVRFKTPVAPYTATLLEKKEIDLDDIFCRIRNLKEPFFVEGAGGLMVPVTKEYFMIDFPKDLNLEVILISPLRIGTINHSLLSIDALKRRDIKIKGIILNDNDGIETPASKTNLQILSQLTDVDILGVVPFRFADYKNLDSILKTELLI